MDLTLGESGDPEKPACQAWVAGLKALVDRTPWRQTLDAFQNDSLLSLTHRCIIGAQMKVGQDFANLVNMVLLALKVDR